MTGKKRKWQEKFPLFFRVKKLGNVLPFRQLLWYTMKRD